MGFPRDIGLAENYFFGKMVIKRARGGRNTYEHNSSGKRSGKIRESEREREIESATSKREKSIARRNECEGARGQINRENQKFYYERLLLNFGV